MGLVGKAIEEILDADTDITTITGSDQIFPVVVPQGKSLPAVVYTVIDNDPSPTKDDSTRLDEYTVQISAYSTKYSDVDSLADEIKDALNRPSATYATDVNVQSIQFLGENDTYELDGNNLVYHRAMRFEMRITQEALTPFSNVSVGTATCAQLNSNLSHAQRQLIHRVEHWKSGMTTSYATGDDGDTQLGRGVNITTLDCNNAFGNTNRFTDSAGNQNYDGTGGSLNDYAIDHKTGLGWRISAVGTHDWATAISTANALTYAGFSDWRVASAVEMAGLWNFGVNELWNYAPFNLSGSAIIHTSTRSAGSVRAFYKNGGTISGSLVAARNYYACRNHYA